MKTKLLEATLFITSNTKTVAEENAEIKATLAPFGIVYDMSSCTLSKKCEIFITAFVLERLKITTERLSKTFFL
jgi:hypothetical protein